MLLSDAVGAVRAVRLLLLSHVGLLLSGDVRWCCRGGCQALTHISHTYDTIKRALTIKGALTPMTPAATQLPQAQAAAAAHRRRRPPPPRRRRHMTVGPQKASW